jgi:hypothetical protein
MSGKWEGAEDTQRKELGGNFRSEQRKRAEGTDKFSRKYERNGRNERAGIYKKLNHSDVVLLLSSKIV